MGYGNPVCLALCLDAGLIAQARDRCVQPSGAVDTRSAGLAELCDRLDRGASFDALCWQFRDCSALSRVGRTLHSLTGGIWFCSPALPWTRCPLSGLSEHADHSSSVAASTAFHPVSATRPL